MKNRSQAVDSTRNKLKNLYKEHEKDMQKYKDLFKYLIEEGEIFSGRLYKEAIDVELKEVGRLRNFVDTIDKISNSRR